MGGGRGVFHRPNKFRLLTSDLFGWKFRDKSVRKSIHKKLMKAYEIIVPSLNTCVVFLKSKAFALAEDNYDK